MRYLPSNSCCSNISISHIKVTALQGVVGNEQVAGGVKTRSNTRKKKLKNIKKIYNKNPLFTAWEVFSNRDFSLLLLQALFSEKSFVKFVFLGTKCFRGRTDVIHFQENLTSAHQRLSSSHALNTMNELSEKDRKYK